MDNLPNYYAVPPEGVKYTLEDLEKDFAKVLLMEDKGVLPLCVYTIVANKMKLGPVWVCIVAPPSGGKSELLTAFFELDDYVHPLSSLTPQTLISGMRQAGGKSSSLLDEIIGKTVIMKDLTTIVEMSKEDRRAILAQMREVYDKRFDKAFGTGERKQWEGHVGWLGAITPEGAEIFGSRGAMGERFIFYRMKMPDRFKVLEKSAENSANNMSDLQMFLKACVNRFMEPILAAAEAITDEERKVILDKQTQKTVFRLAEFTTRARSSVHLHWKTEAVEYVYPPEMPTRFANQLIGIAGGAMFIYHFLEEEVDGLKERDLRLIADICWGSIPAKRADIIKLMAAYKQGTTKAVAAKMGYETGTVRTWLLELAGLKLIKRLTSTANSDVWYMNQADRDLVCEYNGIKMLDYEIVDDDPDYDEPADPNDPDIEEAVRLAEEANKRSEGVILDPETGQLMKDGMVYDENHPDHPDYF